MGFPIDRVVLRHIQMPLVHFFETSFSRTFVRDIVLVEVWSGGVRGLGEVTAGEHPYYNEEWTASAWLILERYVIPRVLGEMFDGAEEVAARTEHVRGHLMARGGLEAAVWDLDARLQGMPLWQRIGGGAHREIACGVSIGVQDQVEDLFEKIEVELAAGYRRIKMKIKPGWDVEVVRQVRQRFPSIALMADANSAYTLADGALLAELDRFGLTMIEQPLAHDDLIDHAQLQRQLETAICLDECIRKPRHAEQAIAIEAGRILNIKLGRVGGFTNAVRIHDIARAAGVPVWCGGMLESGVGRAHNLALSSLPGFTLPGDVSASARYWQRDITTPVEVSAEGTIALPSGVGFGLEMDWEYLRHVTVREQEFRPA